MYVSNLLCIYTFELLALLKYITCKEFISCLIKYCMIMIHLHETCYHSNIPVATLVNSGYTH